MLISAKSNYRHTIETIKRETEEEKSAALKEKQEAIASANQSIQKAQEQVKKKEAELQKELTKIKKEYEERAVAAERNSESRIKQELDAMEEEKRKIHEDKLFIDHQKDTLLKASEMFAENYAHKEVEIFDSYIARLRNKFYPAIKAADLVSSLKRETKEKLKQFKQYEYIIKTYESMFPWLEDFKEIPMENTFRDSEGDHNEDEEIFSRYLSDNEQKTLTKPEKFQRALDRYTNSWDKTNWQIGLFYERYNGYLKEKEGYKVIMNGAQKRWQDMGIDLIATKDNKTELIQCKYWAKDKSIYEKYIFQLFGTTINYISEHFDLSKYDPMELLAQGTVKPVFITSTQLSDTARHVSKALHIQLLEGFPLQKDYPKIKCNPSSQFGKIYHLPFDQQYDNFQVSQTEGAFYAETIKEAEDKGFRRAYRWHGKAGQGE